MKYLLAVLCFMMGFNTSKTHAQDLISTTKSIAVNPVTDSVKKGPYQLVFINRDSAFATKGILVKQRMIDAFFKVYPEEAQIFNPNAAHKVIFIIDPTYDGVAATWADTVHFNPSWMLKTPTDIDVVTHEVMHIVQEYGYSAGPVWLTEGIADYARYKFGVDNAGAGWSMPNYKAGQSYANSYRITARFLVWVEEKKMHNFVQKIDANLRAHNYNYKTWDALTGKSLDALWLEYTDNPSI
jgi:hypothetical protein